MAYRHRFRIPIRSSCHQTRTHNPLDPASPAQALQLVACPSVFRQRGPPSPPSMFVPEYILGAAKVGTWPCLMQWVEWSFTLHLRPTRVYLVRRSGPGPGPSLAKCRVGRVVLLVTARPDPNASSRENGTPRTPSEARAIPSPAVRARRLRPTPTSASLRLPPPVSLWLRVSTTISSASWSLDVGVRVRPPAAPARRDCVECALCARGMGAPKRPSGELWSDVLWQMWSVPLF